MPTLSSPWTASTSNFTLCSARTEGIRHRGRLTLATAAAVTLALVSAACPAAAETGDKAYSGRSAFQQVNLVSDIPGLAQLTDPDLVNPWGMDFGPKTRLWVANEGANKITLYSGATTRTPTVMKAGLVIKATAPTGMLFNPTKKFVIVQGGQKAPAHFLMSETQGFYDGTTYLTAWSNASAPPAPTTTVVKATRDGASYYGLALLPATHKREVRLLAVAVGVGDEGGLDMYDGKFRKVSLGSKRAFTDPRADADSLWPSNAAYLKGRVYVSYADARSPRAGVRAPRVASTSAVSVFKPNGKFVKRLASGGHLDEPWGMTIAPKHWGPFGGALLVGNVGDGTINAFNRRSGHYLGTLQSTSGTPIVNVGLRGLKFGNGILGNRRMMIFAAGIGSTPTDQNDQGSHGLIGAITPVDHC